MHRSRHSNQGGLQMYGYFTAEMWTVSVIQRFPCPLWWAAHVLAASSLLQAFRGCLSSPDLSTCWVPPLTPNSVRSPHAPGCSAAITRDSEANFNVRCCCVDVCCSLGSVGGPEFATKLRPVLKRAAWGLSPPGDGIPMHRSPVAAVDLGAALTAP